MLFRSAARPAAAPDLHRPGAARLGAVHLLEHYSGEDQINVGSGSDLTIAELAETMAKVVGFSGRFVYDASKPDGTPRKLLDVSRLAALGWRARIALEDGLRLTYDWYKANARAA